MASLDMPLEDFAQAAACILLEEFAAVRHILPEAELREVSERMRRSALLDFEAFGPVLPGDVAEGGLANIREECRATVASILAYEKSLDLAVPGHRKTMG